MPAGQRELSRQVYDFFMDIKDALTVQTIVIITVCLVAIIVTAGIIKKHKRKG